MSKSTLPPLEKLPGDVVKHQILLAILDDDTHQWLEYMAQDASYRSGLDWSEGEVVRRVLSAARLAYIADVMQRPRSRSLSAVSFLNYLGARSKVFGQLIEAKDDSASDAAEGGEDPAPAK